MTLVPKSHWLSLILKKAGVVLGYFFRKIPFLEDIKHLTSETCIVLFHRLFCKVVLHVFHILHIARERFLLFFFSNIEITSGYVL